MIFFSVSLYCLQRIGNFKLFIYQPYPKLFIIDSHLSTLANIIKSLKYYITQLSITQMFFRVYETNPSCQLPHPKVIPSTQPYFYRKPRFIFSQIKIRFPSLDILQNHWETLFYQHFISSYPSTLDINATNSTCEVCGNISTGCTSFVRYPPSSKIRKSRANVDGLQDTYTIRFGSIPIIASNALTSQPFRGGSTTITSGRNPCLYHHGITFSASPTTNSTLPIPLSFAFSFALLIAFGTTSTP